MNKFIVNITFLDFERITFFYINLYQLYHQLRLKGKHQHT